MLGPQRSSVSAVMAHQGHGGECGQAPASPQPPALTPRLCVADVDECELGKHNCQPGFTCQNTEGSFYCQARQRCMDGFLQDPEGNCVGERGPGAGSGRDAGPPPGLLLVPLPASVCQCLAPGGTREMELTIHSGLTFAEFLVLWPLLICLPIRGDERESDSFNLAGSLECFCTLT